jgi:hypothetical protein
MRTFRIATLALAALLLVQPLAPRPAHASDDETADSRIGVMLMVTCGVALKAAFVAPVPWAGIAVASCAMGLIDAALSRD